MATVRLKPTFTICTGPTWAGRNRHTVMIRTLGKCRFCGETRLYTGPREEMLDKLAEAFLSLYCDLTSEEHAVSIDDTFFAEVMNLAEDELPAHVAPDSDLEVDYDVEGLRIIRQALLRAAGKIEAHLNAAGEDT